MTFDEWWANHEHAPDSDLKPVCAAAFKAGSAAMLDKCVQALKGADHTLSARETDVGLALCSFDDAVLVGLDLAREILETLEP